MMTPSDSLGQDVSRKRLQNLKGIVKNLLFNNGDDTISEKDLHEECSDITDPEIKIFLDIIELIRPYISSEKNLYLLIHQFPLVFLAKDIHKKNWISAPLNKNLSLVYPLTDKLYTYRRAKHLPYDVKRKSGRISYNYLTMNDKLSPL